MSRQLKTITAAELIEVLQDLPADALVAFASNYGDRGNTQQVHAIRGDADESLVTESAYSDSGFAVSSDPADEEDEEDGQTVYVIS